MEITRHWRLQKTKYTLTGDLCFVCHKPTFPPKDVCSSCNIEELIDVRKNKGIIFQSENNINPNNQIQTEQA